jgi:DNA polymerase-3 subunit delta'
MFFKDIPGHQQVKDQLIASVIRDRIPHAQLILGRNGVGHLPLALAYISYIMCLDRLPTDSCGECKACQKTHQFIHPDVHWSMPVIGVKDKLRREVTSNDFLPQWRDMLRDQPYATMAHWMQEINSDNKQADINVKECNTIMQKLGLKSFESDYKILLMWMPEYLGQEGNRLLKLIEEPTDNTILLLVAQDQQRILNTILSRCQVTYVHDVSVSDLAAHLQTKHSLPADQADTIARAADGSVYKALSLMTTDSIDYAGVLLEWLRVAFKADPVAMQSLVDQLNGWPKAQQQYFYEYGISFFREYMAYLINGQPSPRLSTAEQETVENMRRIIDLDKAESITNILSDCIDALARNLNMRVQLMAHSLTISMLLKSTEKVVTLYRI